MITVQEIAPQDQTETEEALLAWLAAKSTEEFGHFLATAWVASLFSPEVIEQLYYKFQHQEEEAPQEVGLD